jgi:hypothetical protein
MNRQEETQVMTPASAADGNVAITPDERRVLDQLRQLPPEALPRVEEYLSLLATRAANPGCPDASTPARVAELLGSEAFVRVVRHLPPAEAELILEFATFVAGRCLTWSYDDPASLALATALMGLDPFLRREVEGINQEFEGTVADGLEPY